MRLPLASAYFRQIPLAQGDSEGRIGESMAKLPLIERRCACIATDNQVALAAQVSSCFQISGSYLPVFHFPPITVPYSPSFQFGDDNWFRHLLGTRAAICINNALARINPEVILLLGLSQSEESYLREILPPQKLISIAALDELPKRLPLSAAHPDPITCQPCQLIQGLLHAKFTCRPLVIDENAPPLQGVCAHGGEGVVVIENGMDMHDVAALNYAFAINADVALVAPIERKEISLLPRVLHDWGRDRSCMDFHRVRHLVTTRLPGVDFRRYKFATFFTTGLPYGLIIKNIIPCSHVMKDINCGITIVNTIAEEQDPVSFGSALLFSPSQFAMEETQEVSTILDKSNFLVKRLLGKQATVKHLENYGSYFPYDLLHICAHGGESDGYYVTQTFTDRQGNEHKIEFYEVVGFSPSGGDMVKVERKAIFSKFDGYPWGSPILKGYPGYIYDDLMKALKGGDDTPGAVARKRFDAPIATSCHIQCHDSIHQGFHDSVAGFGSPLIFNNTCSSSHEIAGSTIGAGARAYIGTLWSVKNETASEAAKVFYKDVAEHGSILAAFVAMNKSIRDKRDRDIYIFWGLHIASLRKPTRKSDAGVLNALVQNYFAWLSKIANTADQEVKRNSVQIAGFLLHEILTRLPADRRREIPDFRPERLQEYERSLPAHAGDFRDISEIDLDN